MTIKPYISWVQNPVIPIAMIQMCIRDRSYTSKLLQSGKEKILRKVSEEATEVLLASLENDEQKKEHLQWEIADLLYHLLVLIQHEKLNWYDIMNELKKRRK